MIKEAEEKLLSVQFAKSCPWSCPAKISKWTGKRSKDKLFLLDGDQKVHSALLLEEPGPEKNSGFLLTSFNFSGPE